VPELEAFELEVLGLEAFEFGLPETGMLEFLGSSILSGAPPIIAVTLSTIVSLILGLAVASVYRFRSDCSQNMAKTLVLLPAMVQIIIFLASGNIGVGIAVAGAFSLIRFRSMAGNARDIAHLFFAMALGFVTGMGYLFYAFMFLVCVGCASLLLTVFQYGKPQNNLHNLRIKIPESLNFEGVFDDIFAKYTESVEMERVKTTQMGSLYELTFSIKLKKPSEIQAFIDELRIRNGNLSITLNCGSLEKYEL